MKLKKLLSEVAGTPLMKVISNPYAKAFAKVNEAEDDKYVSIGFGRFKEKGKEDNPDAPTFTKTDSGKYVPTSGSDSKPKDTKGGVNIFGKDYDAGGEKSKPQATVNPLLKNASKHDLDDMSKPFTVKVYKDGSDTYTMREYDFENIEDAQKYAEKTGGKLFKKAQEKGRFGKTVSYLKDVPSEELPKSEPSQPKRQGNPQVNKATLAKAKELGITPQKLGKEEYQKKMTQAAVAALTDANFHSEARELISKLEGKPEWAEDPRQSAPKIDSPDYDKWRESSVYSSEYYDADDATEDLGVSAAQEAGWSGNDAADSIAFTLRMNGFHKLADTIQSVIKENKSTRLKNLLPEVFFAINNSSGKHVVFKSKDARDAAVKAGTHSMDDEYENGSDTPKDKPKVNIFDKPKKDKEEPKSQSSDSGSDDDFEFLDAFEMEEKLDSMDLSDDVRAELDRQIDYLQGQEYELENAREEGDDDAEAEIEDDIARTRDEIGKIFKSAKKSPSKKKPSKDAPTKSSYSGDWQDMQKDMQNAFKSAGISNKVTASFRFKDNHSQLHFENDIDADSLQGVLDKFNQENGTNFQAGKVKRGPQGWYVAISEDPTHEKLQEHKNISTKLKTLIKK